MIINIINLMRVIQYLVEFKKKVQIINKVVARAKLYLLAKVVNKIIGKMWFIKTR